MSLKFRQLDRKSRRLFAIADLCLPAGLILLILLHPASQLERNWLHGVAGFLLGLSITINLFGLRRARGVSQTKP